MGEVVFKMERSNAEGLFLPLKPGLMRVLTLQPVVSKSSSQHVQWLSFTPE